MDGVFLVTAYIFLLISVKCVYTELWVPGGGLKIRILFVGTRTNVLHVQFPLHKTYVACSIMINDSNININSNMKWLPLCMLRFYVTKWKCIVVVKRIETKSPEMRMDYSRSDQSDERIGFTYFSVG